MDRKRRVSGFTMAEMLIVVAIIMVLGGVAFIAVTSHQRSMAQLERDTVAKEIFFAAQNHLTMAESQGFLPDENGTVVFGNIEETVTSSTGRKYDNVYSFSVSGGSSFTGNSVLDLMLPFGSIDETVRAGGSYIIRYQAKPALVLDVFYCPKATSSSGQLNYTHDLGKDDYSTVAGYAGLGKNRKNCLNDNCVLGWYGEEGMEGIEDSGEYVIETPIIEVINKERLIVNITDPNKNKTVSPEDMTPLASLCLIITGEKVNGETEASRAQVAILLDDKSDRVKWIPAADGVEPHYEVILDDITTQTGEKNDGLHFADLNDISDTAITIKKDTSSNPIKFKPGENITIQAVAYSNSKLTNIAYSVEKTTNSLFADSQTVTGGTGKVAMISNFRHLENLDIAVSGLDSTLGFNKAEQIGDLAKPASAEDSEGSGTDGEGEEDLSWTGFVNAIKAAKDSDTVKVYAKGDKTGTEAGCFRPIDLNYALDYDGKNHKIEGVEVKYGADAGLFGNISVNESKISNFKIIDFNIATSSGNAGALAGTLTDTTVENIVAYHTKGKADTAKITTTSGNAGGLIGSIAGATSVSKSAAALIVESKNGDAGGLIGTSTSTGTVSACYSGGHTHDGTYYKENDTGKKIADYNITATANAGGLIGDAGSTTITNCYSTCSVTGVTAGGFVGNAGGTLTASYCTGLVGGTNKGAFAGELALTGKTQECSYFEIINEQLDNTDYPYLWALGNAPTDQTSVAKIDESANNYNTFVGALADWREAEVCDDDGRSYYTVQKTNADGTTKTVKMYYLGTNVYNSGINTEATETTPADFVATHYGDWPAPEIFVVNTAS